MLLLFNKYYIFVKIKIITIHIYKGKSMINSLDYEKQQKIEKAGLTFPKTPI